MCPTTPCTPCRNWLLHRTLTREGEKGYGRGHRDKYEQMYRNRNVSIGILLGVHFSCHSREVMFSAHTWHHMARTFILFCFGSYLLKYSFAVGVRVCVTIYTKALDRPQNKHINSIPISHWLPCHPPIFVFKQIYTHAITPTQAYHSPHLLTPICVTLAVFQSEIFPLNAAAF